MRKIKELKQKRPHIPAIRRPMENKTGTGRDVEEMAMRLIGALRHGQGFEFEVSLGTAKADHLWAGLLVTLEQQRYADIRAKRLEHAYRCWNNLKALCIQSGVANPDNPEQLFNVTAQLTPEEIKALARFESVFCYGTNWVITRHDVESFRR